MFNHWGNPYDEDQSWRELKIGDRVLVRPNGIRGTLTEIDEDGTYMVHLDSGVDCGYDADMLKKIERQEKQG